MVAEQWIVMKSKFIKKQKEALQQLGIKKMPAMIVFSITLLIWKN